jgi:TolB-like protein/Flp pilus assembly protein TadD
MKALFAELKRRNVIRVAVFYGAAAWLVMQVSDVVLELIGAPEGSLRVIAALLLLGLPFAVILAWAFEITPEGIKRESEVDRSGAALAASGRKLDVATIALLLVAIGLFSWVNFRESTAPATGENLAPIAKGAPADLSIAVLPFVNISTDPDNEYFSEGLSEELLNVLARIENFRVAGRTSSFAFKGQNQDLRAIGERLSVANILEGSVRKHGDRVRVTAQLIDARSGYHLWSDTYDRQLDDIFAIQDEIATEVVKALRTTLLPADEVVIGQTLKGDVAAYNHYLRGQFHARLRTRAGLERALEEFQHAIVIDPEYAPPYAGVAMVYALLDNYSYRSLAETGPLAHGALERALALDPNSDEAWAVRGLLLGQGPAAAQRRGEARAALQRAVEINPNNAFAHLWLGSAQAPDRDAMRAALLRAYDLDPLSPVIVYRRVMEALQTGDKAALGRFLGELQEVAPDWFMTWSAVSSEAMNEGRIADAALALERAVALNPEYPSSVGALAQALDMLGYTERAERLLLEGSDRFDSRVFDLFLAAHRARHVLLQEGRKRAFEIYAPAIEAMPEANVDQQTELAMLEIGIGSAEAAEQRLRTAMGLDADQPPPAPALSDVYSHMVFVGALAAQDKQDAALAVAGPLRELLAHLGEAGANFVPVAMAYVDYVTGVDDQIEAGLRESLRLGWRVPPAALGWLLPPELDGARLARLMAIMEESLQSERARYDAAGARG